MSKDKKNIEDFLRDKLDGLEHGYRNDWAQFEEKLERALFFYRLKIGAMISAILILVSLGIFGTSAFIESERREQATSEEAIQNWNIPESIQKQPARVGTTDEPGRRASQTGVQFWPELSSIILENQASSQKFKDAFGAPTSYNKASSERTMASRVEQGPNELVSKLLENGNRMSSRTAESSSKINQGPISMVPEPGQLSGERRTPEQEYRAASNKKLKPEADARPNQSNVELKLPLIPPKLSLNMDMTGLKAQLAKGELGELRVKPPIMPVNLERVGPYISPMQHKSRWSYALSVYPNFTFRKFKVDKDKLNRIHRDFIDATQSSERGGFSLNIGARASRRIGAITYVNAGVEYINYKTKAEFDFLNFREAQIDPGSERITHYTMKDEPERIQFNDANVYHYLNFPLSISHQPWASDHIRLNIEAGASFMYFLTARGKSINYLTLEVIDLKDRNYRKSMGAFHMKVGATYHLSPNFNLGFEPTFVYFTNTIYTEEYPFEVIPYSIGVNLKLQMRLN